MSSETSRISENSAVSVESSHHDAVQWRVKWKVDKYQGDTTDAGALYETVNGEGNLLMYGGASCLFEALIGNGSATAGGNLTYFNNANAAIGVGDSTVASSATMTDLQGTNKYRQAMDATYPQHTDGTASGSASVTYKATFGTSVANYAWNEWGVFNSATLATGRMLNRKQEALGTKTSSSTWAFTVTLTLA